jgi:hypothetical protein
MTLPYEIFSLDMAPGVFPQPWYQRSISTEQPKDNFTNKSVGDGDVRWCCSRSRCVSFADTTMLGVRISRRFRVLKSFPHVENFLRVAGSLRSAAAAQVETPDAVGAGGKVQKPRFAQGVFGRSISRPVRKAVCIR